MPLEVKTFVPVGGIGYAQKLDIVYNINFTPLPVYVKEHFHYKIVLKRLNLKFLTMKMTKDFCQLLSLILLHLQNYKTR